MEHIPPFNPGLFFCDAGRKGYLNLAIGETPYGMSPYTQKALIDAAAIGELPYPDSSGAKLVNKIAAHYQVDPDMVFLGNGTDEIILCSGMAFLAPSDTCLMCRPTFPGFESAVKIVRGTPVYSPLKEMRVDVEHVAALLQKSPRLWFLCNPHNPTGTIVAPSEQEYLIEIAHRYGVVTIVDEAYAEYADPKNYRSALSLIRRYPNVLITRTLSKAYGIAGLRCGYAIGNKLLIQELRKTRNVVPFNVNGLAIEVGAAALEDQDFVQEVYRKTEEVKRHFCTWLNERNLSFVPSYTNFVLVHFKSEADPICDRLRDEYRILVRSGRTVGYPNSIRITLGSMEQMKHLTECLDKVLADYRETAFSGSRF